MSYKTLLSVLCLFTIFLGVYYGVRLYRSSGQYIDSTFSNKIADNKQFPASIEGFCFGGSDILAARVLNETPSSLFLEVTYCNEEVSDRAVLGLGVTWGLDVTVDQEGGGGKWAYTPGGTVSGYGKGYVRLNAYNLERSVTLSDYTLSLYRNDARTNIISYPFRYEKMWCTESKCND